MLDERVFLELIDSIKSDARNGVQMFPMSELNKLYIASRQQLNLETIPHTTRLKERILEHFGDDLQEQGTETGPKTHFS